MTPPALAKTRLTVLDTVLNVLPTHFETIRIAQLDDHVGMRVGLKSLIADEPDLIFVGAAANEAELWPLLHRTGPSLVVIDLHHPGRDGLALCFELKAMIPTPAVLVYSGTEHEHLRVAAFLAGADGFVSKGESRRALLEAIRMAARREGGPVPVAPSLRARAALHLDPTDRAIFAMRLAGTAARDIAATTALPPSIVAERIAVIASHLSSFTPQAGEPRNGTDRESGAAAPYDDPPRLRARKPTRPDGDTVPRRC